MSSIRPHKRRRLTSAPPLSARLTLDASLRSESGVLSQDLAQEFNAGSPSSATVYVAVTPWTPAATPADADWVILPFKAEQGDRPLPASTIRLPTSAAGTGSFVNLVQSLRPSWTVRQGTSFEVKAAEVTPVPLETVFVSLDADAIKRFEEAGKKYGSGLQGSNGLRKQAPEQESENDVEVRRKKLVHSALEQARVVHTNDILPLDLRHPITHAAAPPARILACEPVSQGLLAPSTRIVLTSSSTSPSHARQNFSAHRALMSPRLDEETETETDAFYSATEEHTSPAKPIVTSKSTTDLSNTDDLFDSSTEESTLSNSDSDGEDTMIALVKPSSALSGLPSGMSSVRSAATLRAGGGGRGTHGISTPGSVFSAISSSTLRGGRQGERKKSFRAQGLVERISEEMLHPKPGVEDDEECRVYVEAQALARLGCFSGDWARIEASENGTSGGLAGLGAALGGVAEDGNWRPVKVYSLPEGMSKKASGPRYQIGGAGRHGRRDSISSLTTTTGQSTTATLHLSPILLANLGQPENVSLSPLPLKRTAAAGSRRPGALRPSSAGPQHPPVASEVTLRKIVTPLSGERALEGTLYAGLRDYFERKQRVLQAGDLIAIPVDENLGRAVHGGEGDDAALLAQGLSESGGKKSVAWFSVESVSASASDKAEEECDPWSGAVLVDPRRMTMRQSGDERRNVPPTTNNPWEYYTGVRKLARRPTPAAGLPEPPTRFISTLHRRGKELIAVSTSPRAAKLRMPPLALLLTSTQRSIGKAHLIRQVCSELGLHYFPISGFDIAAEGSGSGGGDTQSQGLLEARCDRALDCGAENTVLCLTHLETLTSERVAASLKDVLGRARVLVATTTDVDKLGDGVRGLFTHELEMSAPDEGEREGILRDLVAEAGEPISPEVDLKAIAVKTAALVAGDLQDVVERAIAARSERLDSLIRTLSATTDSPLTLRDLSLSGGAAATSLIPADFTHAVDHARTNFADAIGAPKIPNVQWSDVGGLTHVKDAVIETIQLPLARPELFAKGLKKRSGILFYGPPGTGKTLLAKAIATEFSLNFFSVKGPELLNMYIGESEANVRRVFQRARDARPCVVFFDELDSVAPKRGNQGDSGGVMDRIVSQLLAELDGMSGDDGDGGGGGGGGGGGVFVIGATNRPDLLDQALLRPGRFDKMLYLGISDTHAKQETILRALTRKYGYSSLRTCVVCDADDCPSRFTLSPDLSLLRVAESLPFTFTGADLYALCSDAMLKAVTRSARLVDEKLAVVNRERLAKGQTKASVAYYFDHHATERDTDVEVGEEDFVAARRELVPSVSQEELGHYERVRAMFEGGDQKKAARGSGSGESPRPPSAPHSRPSTASGQSRPPSAQQARPAPNLRRLSNQGKQPATNGHGLGGADSEDDMVARRQHMSLSNGHGYGKGKGKGKAVVRDAPLPAVQADGDDLYD